MENILVYFARQPNQTQQRNEIDIDFEQTFAY